MQRLLLLILFIFALLLMQALGGSLDTAQLSITFSDLEYYDSSTLSAGFASEVAAVSSGTAATDDVSVSSVVTSGGTTTVTSTIPLTAAQILQQFLASDEAQDMSSTNFPIFATTTQVLVTVVGNATGSSTYDFTCRDGANCYGVGSCYNGLCGCVPDADDVCTAGSLPVESLGVCASGATLATPFADACASTLSTVDELVYLADSSCESQGMVNLYPRRRFCQNRDYSSTLDRNVFTGLLGNPYDYGNSTGGLRLFTISSPYTMEQLQSQNRTSDVIATRAYVSNLYDNAAPVASKVWAHVEFERVMYSANAVQLTRLVFLDAIEGDRGYYFQGNRWRPYPYTLPQKAYAYWNNSAGAVAWECQLLHVYNAQTCACEPGCNNGLVGVDCNVPFANTTCPVRSFDASTTLYIGYSCDTAVCLPGYFLGAFGCVANLEQPPDTVTEEEDSSSSSSTVDAIVISCSVVAAIFALGAVYAILTQRRMKPLAATTAPIGDKQAATRGRARPPPVSRSSLSAISVD
jgi:hypothetical protein